MTRALLRVPLVPVTILLLAMSVGASHARAESSAGSPAESPAVQRDERFAAAARNADQAALALAAADRAQRGWAARADARTGLLPQNLRSPLWTPANSAADLYPFFVLTSYFTERDAYEGRWKRVLLTETLLTNRLGSLPDDYSLERGAFVHPEPDVARIIFGASEYVKDGLVPITDLLGPTPWLSRLREIVDGILERLPVESRFGPLPSDSAEVNGNMLQSLARLYWATADRRYLDAGERILRAYFEEVLPACGGLPVHAWSFVDHRATSDLLSLNDHGNEIVGGLAEFYLTMHAARPDAAEALRPTMERMIDRLLAIGRNPDGLWVNRLKPTSGEVLDATTPDTWGYGLTAVYMAYLVTGKEDYRAAVVKALEALSDPAYLSWDGADSFADSIEGGILLVNREPVPQAVAWLDAIFPKFLAFQQQGGIVEGWHGDGNFARTALLYALMKSQGTHVEPWRSDLRLGATRDGDRLLIHVAAGAPWSGVLRFDEARWREHWHLPMNYPHLNEFPVWFAAAPSRVYRLEGIGGGMRATGLELHEGIAVEVAPGRDLRIVVEPEPAVAEVREIPELTPAGFLLEVETLDGPWRHQTNYPGYSGTGFLVSNASGIAKTNLSGKLRVVKPGEYVVWARGLVTPNGDRAFSAQVGSTRFPPTHRTGAAAGFPWERCGTVRLDAGEVELRIHDEGQGYECPDALFFSQDVSASPGGEAALAVPDEASRETLSAANRKRLIDAHAADDARRRASVRDAQEWEARRKRLVPEVRKLLGLDPAPERTPLAARTVGVLERGDVIIEKVVLESRPGMPVPVNLYLPQGAAGGGRRPAVLCPVGHWGLSKAEPVVQARAFGFAKLGLVALVYDALGQGERAVPGNEHSQAHLASLAGESNMTYMVWDSVRAIDYLETRPEVDLTKLGVTGCSGGGLNTLYLGAVEDRLTAAAPVCYVCTFDSFFATGITHCPCSHVPGMARLTDMGEVVALLAPRPSLVVGGTRDPMFTEAGARAAFSEVRRLYELSGAADRATLFFDACAHDYSQPMRERAYGFFVQHLLGRDAGDSIREPMAGTGWKAEDPATLACFPSGKVPADSVTYRGSVLARLESSRGRPAAEVVARLRSLLPEADRAASRVRDLPPREDGTVLSLVADAEGFEHRVLSADGDPGPGTCLVVIEDGGLTGDTPALLRSLLEAGAARACAIEPPLWGERGDARHLAVTNGLLTGRPVAALWARSLLGLVRKEAAAGRKVALLSRGAAASTTALVVTLVAGDGITALAATRGPSSWVDLVEPGTDLPGALLPGAGACGDIPDLLRAAPCPVLWAGAPLRARLPLAVEVRGADVSALEGWRWLRERPGG